jgi:dihydropteroate synthase
VTEPHPVPSFPATVEVPAGRHHLTLRAGVPAVMGIVNTNPGSFSDTQHLVTTREQLDLAVAMVDRGADVIDVGTDSGVTYGEPIDLDVQVQRAVPLVRELADRGVVVSVDTPFVRVAEACLEAGAAIVNDVSGLAEPRMAELCAAHGAALVILHTRVEHKREAFLDFDDVVADVESLFVERRELAQQRGLPAAQVVFDPGLGYAKHPHDDLEVLRAYPRFAALGQAILTGASRKYFTGVITGTEPPDRLPETLATVEAVRQVPGIVRVHDVDEVVRYLAVAVTVDGLRELPAYDTRDDSLKWVPPTDTDGPGGSGARARDRDHAPRSA